MRAGPLITEHIDLWTSTIKARNTQGRGSSKKRELYGITKLRELILELAVRGLLVPQDFNDEPASVFLEKIVAEKLRLVEEKNIKAQRLLPVIGREEKPFDLPNGWEFKRLGDLAYVFSGNSFKSGDFSKEGGARAIKITNVGVRELIQTQDYLPESFLETYSAYRVFQGDLLLALTRPYISTGLKVSTCTVEYHNALLNQRVAAIRAFADTEFLYQYMQSVFVLGLYQKRFNGSGLQPNLKMSDVTGLVIPIPPEAEQHRIVTKADELMALCDQLEQQTESSLDAHNLLVDTLLATLTDARDANELNTNWARLAEHFDTLITTDYAVEQLKQTILQLAVMGRLVPQNSNDEPASELLKRIAVEKEQLVKDRVIRKQKPLADVIDEEKPFEVPEGWEWVRFGKVTVSRLGKMLDKAKNKGKPLPYLRNTNVQWNRFELDDIKLMNIEESEIEELLLRKGDLLICEGGHPGRCAIWVDEQQEMFFQKALHRARPMGNVLSEYLQCCLTTDAEAGGLDKYFTGATIKHFVGAKLNSYVIPMPPVEEQRRLIAKVDDLIGLCDKLKARLSEAQTTQLQLADTIVDEALA